MRNLFLVLFLMLFFGCKEAILPKPKAYLSLTYPEKSYENLKLKRPYNFKVSKKAIVINEKNNWITIKYPATLKRATLCASRVLFILFYFL